MKKALFAAVTLITLSQAWAANGIDRIASAGGDVTEILFELGLGDQVVAVDSTSIYPASVNNLPSVGYVRELSAEGVLSTGADLLIGSHDMGPPAVMDNLEAAGMRVAFVPEGSGPSRFVDKVAFIADVVNKEARGAEIIEAYSKALADIEARTAQLERAPRALLILSVRDGVPIAAGTETTGHDMIEVAGGENVATFSGWKPMSAEAMIAAAPEVILLSDAHVQGLGNVDAVMSLPSVLATPAGETQSYIMMNAQMLLQFGPRSPQAMNEMVAAFETLLVD